MATTSTFTANNVDILEITLINFKGDELSLLDIFEVFDLQYDIFNTTISGSIIIIDGAALQHNFPIIGQEKIKLKFRTEKTLETVEHVMAVYKIADKREISNSTFGYSLYFASPEFLKNKATQISLSYAKQNPVKIIENCLTERLGSKKELFTDTPSNSVEFTAKKQRPFEVINAMLPRSISKSADNSSYVFFEGVKGYYFKTIESMTEELPLFTYTFDRKESVTQTDDGFLTVTKYEQEKTQDIFSSLQSGMYGNTVLVFDPLTLSVKKQTFDYFNDEDYKKLNNIEGKNPDFRLGTDDFEYKSTLGAFKFVMKNQKSERLNTRITKLLQMENSIVFNVECPINTNLECGACINLSVPYPNINKKDQYLSGKYLITSMRHIVENGGSGATCMRLVKDSFGDDHSKEVDRTQKSVAGITRAT